MFELPSQRSSRHQGTEWEYLHELQGMARWLCEGDESSPALRFATDAMDTFRGPEMVRRWIHRLNSVEIEHQIGKGERSEELDLFVEGQTSSVANTGRLQQEVESRLALLERLCQLPDNYRCALLLKEGHGLSVERTAAVMGVSTASIRSILYRARQILRPH